MRCAGCSTVMTRIPGNVAFKPLRMGNAEAADPAFAQAQHVTRCRWSTNRITAVTMEPRGCHRLLRCADRPYTLYTSTQNVTACGTASLIRSCMCRRAAYGSSRAMRRRLRDEGPVYPEEGRSRSGNSAGPAAGEVDPSRHRSAARRRDGRDRSSRRAGAGRRRPVSGLPGPGCTMQAPIRGRGAIPILFSLKLASTV